MSFILSQGLTPRDLKRIERGFLNMTVLQLVQRQSDFFDRVSARFDEFLAARNLPDDSDIPVKNMEMKIYVDWQFKEYLKWLRNERRSKMGKIWLLCTNERTRVAAYVK